MIPSHANCTVMNFNEDLNRSIQERAQHVELKQLEIAQARFQSLVKSEKLDESQAVLNQIYIDVCMFYIGQKKAELVQRKELYRAQLLELMK